MEGIRFLISGNTTEVKWIVPKDWNYRSMGWPGER